MGRYDANRTRNSEIVRRRKAGEWPSAIARSMKLTQGTVLSVCYRNRLCGPKGKKERAKGEQVNTAILGEEEVRTIKRLYKFRDPQFGGRPLAARFRVSETAISHIVLGKTWKHL